MNKDKDIQILRLAITTDGTRISEHFGHCPSFTIVDIENGQIINKQLVQNNFVHGGGGCMAVNEILKFNIDHVITGGMGMGAQQKFANANVGVTAFSGTVIDAIKAFQANLTYDLELCKEHGECH